MDRRKIEEKIFHNNLRKGAYGQRWSPELEEKIMNDPYWSNMKFYSIERKSRMFVENWLIENTKNKVVLDFCCGNGEDSIFMAKNGASKVIGIDISEVSITNCIKRSVSENIDNISNFRVMDAENLEFDYNTFDVVSEYGALHHIDLEKAFKSMVKVLKPNGKMICVEALGHNPIIHLYRKRTMDLRTKWEVDHILIKKDIKKIYKYFNRIEYLGFFHLTTLMAVPFRNKCYFNSLLGTLEKIDEVILKFPFIKWHAWQVVFVLSEPKK